ncbi:MAG: flagellar motor protein MotB [Candidatus Stygibacter australis]|nr:flagellar motor protein MotB [Candidatus Stygibacter australis]MDP8320811.1 flagellar motor protein MotB [Candidatus Stygibacter australis]
MANNKLKIEKLRRKMYELEEDLDDSQNYGDIMTPYGDLMTLLLVFFVFFFILSDIQKSQRIIEQNAKLSEEQAKVDSLLDLNETVITIPGEILFSSGKAELRWQSLRALAQVAENIKREIGDEEGWQIRIEGHTDNVPISTVKYESNWDLSMARALSIVKFFVENDFFPPDQLQAMGYGEFKPIAPNDTDENKRKNRRVEIRLTRKYQ